jgi:hypothetical protein
MMSPDGIRIDEMDAADLAGEWKSSRLKRSCLLSILCPLYGRTNQQRTFDKLRRIFHKLQKERLSLDFEPRQ